MNNSPSENWISIEFERKFLLPFIPEFMRLQPNDDISQWYVPNLRINQKWDDYYLVKEYGLDEWKWVEKDIKYLITKKEFELLNRISERLQPFDDVMQWFVPNFRIRQKEDKFFLTKKYWWDDCNCSQPELEFNITEEEYKFLWKLWNEISLKKNRHYLEVNWRCYEWDKFKEELEPLCMSEVEFPSEEEKEAFIPPKFFWLEVTSDPRFKNYNLAKNWIDKEMMKIIKRVQETMKHIDPIEINLEDWINWIEKWIDNLLEYGNLDRPIFVNVAWWSSSGKTYKISNEIKKIFEAKWIEIEIISMDCFYHGPTFMKKMAELWIILTYDQIEAINIALILEKLDDIYNNRETLIPSYDFDKDPVADVKNIPKCKVIIVEWLFSLIDEVIAKYWDLKVFTNVSTHWRVIRRHLRDAWESWRSSQSPDSVLYQILKEVEPMDKKYVQPQKKNAHIIINNDHNPLVESRNIETKILQSKIDITEINDDIIGTVLSKLWFIEAWKIREVDTYYTHENKCLIESWEVFRIRCEDESEKIKLTYKFPEEKEYHRNEPTFSFGISEELAEMIEEEYEEIWTISKERFTFKKDHIEICIDFMVSWSFVKEWGWYKKIELWNYIEIKWCKDEEEMKNYLDEIIWLININKNKVTSSSYIKMLIKKRNI